MPKRPEIATRLDHDSFVLKALVNDIHKRDCQEFPNEFIGEARIRMAALKAEGHIESFSVYDEDLNRIWHRFKRKHSVENLEVLIAAGRPKMPGLQVQKAEGQVLARMTITAPRLLAAQWQPDWLFLKIEEALGASGLLKDIDPAEVYGYWLRYTINGEPVREAPLRRVDSSNPLRKGESAHIHSNAAGNQVDVLFGTFRPFQEHELLRDLKERVADATRNKAEGPEGSGYWAMVPEVLDKTVEDCAAGIQSIGLDLPVNMVAGLLLTDSPFEGDVITGLPPGAGPLYANIFYEMLRLDEAEFTADWYGKKLRVPVSEESVKAIMAVLQARGLVELGDQSGGFCLPETIHAVGHRITEKPPTAYHRSACRAGMSAYQLQSSQRQNFHGTTVALNETDLPKVKDEMRGFREKIRQIIEGNKKRDVLAQLNMQFFPLTRQAIDYRVIGTDVYAQQAEDIPSDILERLILEASAMEVFRAEGSWLAGKLIVPSTTDLCKAAIERLQASGALVFSDDAGRFVDAKLGEEWAESSVFTEFMLQAVELGTCQENSERFQVGTMFAPIAGIDIGHIADECSLMLDRIRRISVSSRGRDQIYRFHFSVFPQTK